jgi:RRXRR protein
VRYVPVVDRDQKPLMPTTANRAASWIKSGKATPFWKKGVFCVRLNAEPSGRTVQEVGVGIDPGSKKEAFTVKSEAHTFLNIQADAVQHVKRAVEVRRQLRRARRYRKTPCRQNRKNRARGGLPPSTKARWQWKLRIATWLTKLYPIAEFVVEDIQARTIKGSKKWNGSFSPLECGKLWFYEQLEKLAPVETKQGWETKELRGSLGLKKSTNKMSETFEAHCVDSWVLANWWTGGHAEPDNREMLFVSPLRFHRRQLHRLEPAKGGIRSLYGGTRSLHLKRGSLVKHSKWGLTYVGGTMGGRISLHSVEIGSRLCQSAKPADCRFLCFNSVRVR